MFKMFFLDASLKNIYNCLGFTKQRRDNAKIKKNNINLTFLKVTSRTGLQKEDGAFNIQNGANEKSRNKNGILHFP